MADISTDKMKRFLLLLPIAAMIVLSIYFHSLTQEIEHNLIMEKFEEKKLEIDLLAYQVDDLVTADQNWYENYDWYKNLLIRSVKRIDEAYMTYAMVFDTQMNPLYDGINEESSFNPSVYNEFKYAVSHNEKGVLTLFFRPVENTPPRDLYVYYRWIPTGKDYKDRILAVTGISRLTIITHLGAWVQVSGVALIVITTVLDTIMVLMICNIKPGGITKKTPAEAR